jgi:hypothetical protein
MHETPTTLLVAERDENTRAFLLDNLAADAYSRSAPRPRRRRT